jgi:hypothetical protein
VLLTFNHAWTRNEEEIGAADSYVLDGEGHKGIIRSRRFRVWVTATGARHGEG